MDEPRNESHFHVVTTKRAVKGYPGLYREDSGKGGMRFRILINSNKQIIQQHFYFGISRTELSAKKIALKRWRELRAIYPALTKRAFREVPRKLTSSGIVGVTRVITVSKCHEYPVWKAVWTTKKGARQSRQFSINKYGEKKAKRLAIEARKKALDDLG
jgi:AP2 domain